MKLLIASAIDDLCGPGAYFPHGKAVSADLMILACMHGVLLACAFQRIGLNEPGLGNPRLSNAAASVHNVPIPGSDEVLTVALPLPGSSDLWAHCPDPSGAQISSCGPTLLHWLCSGANDEDNRWWRQKLLGARVCELGCGTHGLVGLGLSKLGASAVCLTDLPYVLPTLRVSVSATYKDATACDCDVRAAPLVWGLTKGEIIDEPHDLIVAADVCHDQGRVPALATTLSSMLRAQPLATALLALPSSSHAAGTHEPANMLLFEELGSSFHIQCLASLPPTPLARTAGAQQLQARSEEAEQTVQIFAISCADMCMA